MGKLELRRERGTLRHYLDGQAVEVGVKLEVMLRGGQWIAGAYDWNGVEARWPGLRFELGGPWEREAASVPRPPSGVMALHPDAQLRWPRAVAKAMAAPQRNGDDASRTMPMRFKSPGGS